MRKKVIFCGLVIICVLFLVYICMPANNDNEATPAISNDVKEDNSLKDIQAEADNNDENIDKVEESKNEEKEETKTTTFTNNVKGTSSSNYTTKYYIKVNYEQNVVTIYEKDNDGEYTVPVKAMVCSTGTETPRSGVYTIKYRWKWLGLFGDVYGYYVTQIVGDILFHSVPYTAKSPDTLEYWEYDKLGTAASLGCVRLKVVDAKWIYDNVVWGTPVEFYASSDPGPLGKPTAQKISDNVDCRNWDPTDTDSLSPWNKPKEETKIEETEKKEESKEDVQNEENVNIYTETHTP